MSRSSNEVACVDRKQQVLLNTNLLKALLNKTRTEAVDETEDEREMFGELPLRDLECTNALNKRLSSFKRRLKRNW